MMANGNFGCLSNSQLWESSLTLQWTLDIEFLY
jgi:hypothetical protein